MTGVGTLNRRWCFLNVRFAPEAVIPEIVSLLQKTDGFLGSGKQYTSDATPVGSRHHASDKVDDGA
jgi:hypothetical protein